MRVLLVAGAEDARGRHRFVSTPLREAEVDVEVVTTRDVEEGDIGGLRPDVVVLFHGGARTRQRVRLLKKRIGVPVLLRIGGRNDLTGLDLMSGCLGRGRVLEAARHMANVALDSRSFTEADGTICVSEGLADWAGSRFPHPVVVVPPVRPELACADGEFDSRVTRGFRSECILTTANLKYRAKALGIARLIPTFELVRDRCPGIRWKVLGDGPWMGFLKRRVRQSRHGDAIELGGWSNDVQESLLEATQFWYSSRLDAYPLVVSEAMWSGRPVLVERGTPAAGMISEDQCLETGDDWADFSLDLLADADRYQLVARDQRELVRDRESAVTVGRRLREWISSNFDRG